MRRIITTAALGLALLGGAAACADTTDTATPGASGTPSAAVTSAAAKPGTADKATTCAAVKKLEASVRAGVTPAFGALMAAASDPSKGPEALAALEKVILDSIAEAKKIAAEASDPELKTALDEFVTENTAAITALKSANGDVAKAMDALPENAGAAEDKLTKLCP
jgi:murein L,D-transpeptidase YcbB/YkuD